MVGFFAQLDDGVGIQALMTLSLGLGPACIFIASFITETAYWRLTVFDIACGAVSAVAIVVWQVLDNPMLAVLLAVLADLVAGLPTAVKAYLAPRTEHPSVYRNAAINAGITLLTIDHWTAATWAFPVYIAVFGVGLYVLIKFELGPRITHRCAHTTAET